MQAARFVPGLRSSVLYSVRGARLRLCLGALAREFWRSRRLRLLLPLTHGSCAGVYVSFWPSVGGVAAELACHNAVGFFERTH